MSHDSKHRNKWLVGIVVGGIIGSTVSLLDKSNREKMKGKFQEVKASSNLLVHEWKENPKEVRNNVSGKFLDTSHTLQQVARDGQSLYQDIYTLLSVRATDLKEIAEDFIQLYHHSKQELEEITNKMKTARMQMKETPVIDTNKYLPVVIPEQEITKNNILH